MPHFTPVTFILIGEVTLRTPTFEEINDHIAQLQEGLNQKINPTITYTTIHRGESECYNCTALLPKILRKHVHPEYEKNIFIRYQKEYCQNRDHLLILSKMQHDGFPTRLLDWTKCWKVALYFACQAPIEKDGVLYIFTPMNSLKGQEPLKSINREVIEVFLSQITLPHTDEAQEQFWMERKKEFPEGKITGVIPWYFVINPDEFNDDNNLRRLKQHGLFTYHLGYTKIDRYCVTPPSFNDEDIKYGQEFISRIIIPARMKKEIISKLDKIGINSKELFPNVPIFSDVEYGWS